MLLPWSHCYLNLLQMIHFITMALGGEGYLNFMGNEVCILLHSSSHKTAVRCVIVGAANHDFFIKYNVNFL